MRSFSKFQMLLMGLRAFKYYHIYSPFCH